MQPFKPDYRALTRLAIYIAAILVAGAVLAPPVFFAAQRYVAGNPQGPGAELLASKEFPSYYSRCAMLAALLGLFPLLRSLRLNWSAIGGEQPVGSGMKHLVAGFLAAVTGTVLMGLITWWAGACKPRSVPGWENWLMPVLSGFSVSVLEEILFRGVILGILCLSLGARRGLYWTTGVFALVHFLKPPVDGAIAAEQVTWTSGFWVITQLFRGFGHWHNFVGEFLLLFVVGWALGRARLQTNGLWLSIGLHAGWVAAMKYVGQIMTTTTSLRTGELGPWMVPNTCKAIVSPIVGVVPVLMVLLTALVVLAIAGRRHATPREKGVAAPATERQ